VGAIETVERFLSAYFGGDAPGTLALVHDDFEWVSMGAPQSVTRGYEEMRVVVEERNFSFPAPFSEGHHISLAALTEGDLVLHERIDYFTINDVEMEVPCAARFEVADGKVRRWRDYFDMGTVLRQMSAAGVPLGQA
jgi:limonene-1,2-epoxide hydrolase